MSRFYYTLTDRIKLEGYLEIMTPTEAAKRLGCNKSTVYREINRNKLTIEERQKKTLSGFGVNGSIKRPTNYYGYSGQIAQYKTSQRRKEANQTHLKLTDKITPITITIERLIKKRWSPEQISATMRLGRAFVGGIKQKVIIAAQTIYDWIYRFRKDLRKYLRHSRNYSHNRLYYINKKKRKERQEERGIDKRPIEVNKRAIIGHWEGDTILGSNHGATGRIETLVERKTGLLIARLIKPLPERYRTLPEDELELKRLTMGMRFADNAVISLKAKIKPKYLKTLTLDNGSENNGFEWIERGIPGLKVYFARPYHSWERGTNENTNGLLRQYFPKGLDFRAITQSDVDKAVSEINNRPRKRLRWRSPQWLMSHYGRFIGRKESCNLK